MTPSRRPNCAPVVCLASLLLAGCLLPKGLEPAEWDWQAVVTIDDFGAWLANASIELEGESEALTKTKIAWMYELAYDYSGVDARDGEPFRVVLHSEIAVHPNASSALHNANTFWLGLKAGLWKGGASLERVEPSIEWGDGLDCFTVHKDDRQIGNLLIGHRGRTATFVLLSGLYSSDPVLFEELLLPKLRALDDYDPAAPSGATSARERHSEGYGAAITSQSTLSASRPSGQSSAR